MKFCRHIGTTADGQEVHCSLEWHGRRTDHYDGEVDMAWRNNYDTYGWADPIPAAA